MERVGRSERAGEEGTFEPFDLTVTLGPGLHVPWISAASRLGHVHGIPRRRDVPPLEELLESVYDFVDAVRFADRVPDPFLTRALGQLVFGEPSVLELFQATRGVAGDHGHEVLVRILASPHLAVLPWELLPDPVQRHSERDARFLALAPDACVVRLARGRTYPVRSERLEPPLNLLIVLSSPISRDPADDSLAFDIYEEKRSLLAELAPLVEDGLLRIDVEDQPTLENVRRRIGAQRRGYHLFHYIGHAEPDRLILEDEQARRDDLSGLRFTEILRLCPDLRLAVFAGCETARAAGDPLAIDAAAAEGRSLLSLSDRCVQDCCPVVVGMQAVLPFRTERLFTRFFYQGLVSGYSVGSAMRLARGADAGGDRHVGGDLLDWSVPVLFVGGSHPGPLVDPDAQGVPPKPPPRHVLRLGLSQPELRFFARDVALRQAVDILAGGAPERILVLTGPAGVGKTMLIDRAIEELAGPVAILYVDFEALAPAFVSQLQRMRRPDWNPKKGVLEDVDPHAPLEELCKLVAELMARGGGARRVREPGWTPRQWWSRIMEDLTSRRFVLVIDNLEDLAALEEAFTDQVLLFWLAQRLEELQADASAAAGSLPDLLDRLILHVRQSSELTQTEGAVNPLVSRLAELGEWLGGYSRKARARVVAAAERLLRDLRQGEPVDELAGRLRKRASDPKDLEALRAGYAQVALARQTLDAALRMVADRRSGVRLAVGASEMPDGFLDMPGRRPSAGSSVGASMPADTDRRFVMRLGRLTWAETWRWIRRNLPGLLRYGDEHLERLWPRLGPELERWEELEKRILASTSGELQLEPILDEIAPRQGSTAPPSSMRRPTRSRARWRDPTLDRAPRGERPLKVAVAGPFIASAEGLARALTRLAADHGLGGRVVTSDAYESGSLAVMADVPSPFRDGATAQEQDILAWLRTVTDRQPDVILLDYGYRVPLPVPGADQHERPVLLSLRHQFLMIAAGGNRDPGDPTVTAPGVYPEVLAVGPLKDDGTLQAYAEWTPKIRKPDLFMRDQLLGTALQEALAKNVLSPVDSYIGPGTHGSSFSALHAAAAAILAWSIVPDLAPIELKGLLQRAARPIPKVSRPAPMRVELRDAVAAARAELVRRTLEDGPCSLQALSAITGLDLRVANDTLEAMMVPANPLVRRLPRGRLVRFELIRDDSTAVRRGRRRLEGPQDQPVNAEA